MGCNQDEHHQHAFMCNIHYSWCSSMITFVQRFSKPFVDTIFCMRYDTIHCTGSTVCLWCIYIKCKHSSRRLTVARNFRNATNQPTIHTQRDNLPEVHTHTHSAKHISSYLKRDKREQTHTCVVQTASSSLVHCHNYTTELNRTKQSKTKQSKAQHSTYMPI